jgi:hypothetical protein
MKKLLALIMVLTLLLSLCSCETVYNLLGINQTDNEAKDDGKVTDDEKPNETPDTPEDKPEDVKPTVNTEWHTGYVGAVSNKTYSNTINTTASGYAYTDVITLEGSGSAITLTFDKANATDSIYAISHWTNNTDAWEINLDRPNVLYGDKAICSTSSSTVTLRYVTTKNVENIRISIPLDADAYPEIYIEKTSESGSVSDKFVIEEWSASDRERAEYDILYGKTINFIGDSLFGANRPQNWVDMFISKYNLNGENYGISGCTLSACEGGANPIVTRYDKLPDNDPDIVIFEGGRNDYNKSAPMGHHLYPDTESYKGSLATLIKGLREKYPDAILIGVTFWNSTDRPNEAGYVCNDYTQAMIDVCRALGVYCIDATDEEECGIVMTDADFRAQYSIAPSDVCHLNYEGMKLALAFFEKKIASICSKA